MPGILSPSERSQLMASVRSKDTRPERTVRQFVHRLGFRFRLHRKDLPGTPDLVFPGRRAVILVHGCFWHRHAGCKDASMPKSNVEFWHHKFEENVARDKRNIEKLRASGWRTLVIWECELQEIGNLTERIANFLEIR